MARHVLGSTATELRELRETVRKMLKGERQHHPQGKWADVALLEPVRDYKARHASTMLTFDAVVDAIGQIEAKSSDDKAAGTLAPARKFLATTNNRRHSGAREGRTRNAGQFSITDYSPRHTRIGPLARPDHGVCQRCGPTSRL
jgi:hypothetical protein